MSNFNIAINCSNESDAENVFGFLNGLEIYMDGLDFSEDRVSLISKKAIIEDIKNYFKKNKKEGSIEVWPEDVEYDDAESNETLERFEISAPASNKKASGIQKFKAYTANKEKFLSAVAWLKECKDGQLEIIETWEPEVEFGSYGVKFSTTENGLAKQLEKIVPGVITEKTKN